MLDNLDKKFSAHVHNLRSRIIEAGLLFFAILFNPVPILITTVVLGTVFIFYDYKIRDLPPPTHEEQCAISVLYGLHALAVICVTGPMKAILKRPRPDNPKESSDPKIQATARFFNLRGHEYNKSMPSGDTSQSAAFAAYLCLYMPGLFTVLGGNMFRLRLVAAVAAARIFFHCHYIGDTLVGAMVGTLVTYGLATLDV